MDTSDRLGLPYILPSQAQKHVTHNEALRMLDALVQCRVLAVVSGEPPADPAPGDTYIVAEGTGAWAGRDDALATFQDGAWSFRMPAAGWTCYCAAADAIWRHDGTEWGPLPASGALESVDRLGISTTADETNRLAVSSPATLLTHAGTDHRLVINKAAAINTASLVFQTGWSGRAEFGLAGDDRFSVKVSDDGVAFSEAFSVDPSTARPSFPNGLDFGGDALSQYESGSWTPRLTFGGSDTGITYDLQDGYYVRIGALVLLHAGIKLTNKGTATGDAEIADLPFAANPPYYPGTLFFIGGGMDLFAPQCRTVPGNRAMLSHSGSSGMIAITDDNFTHVSNLKITLAYLA